MGAGDWEVTLTDDNGWTSTPVFLHGMNFLDVYLAVQQQSFALPVTPFYGYMVMKNDLGVIRFQIALF